VAESVLVAVISGGVTLLGVLLSNGRRQAVAGVIGPTSFGDISAGGAGIKQRWCFH